MERTMSRGVLRLSVLGTLVLSLIAALPAAVDAEKPVEGLKNLEGEHSGENGEKKGQFMDSFLQTTALVIFSEIGDKTFLIAAILAMKHPRKVIFLASCTSLWLMSYLSAVLGNMMVKMIPLRMVSTLAGVMFLVFALKMYFEAKEMKNDAVLDEMKEIQEELEEKLDGEKINEFDTKDDYNVVVDVISHEIETSQEEKQGLGMSGKDTQENDGLTADQGTDSSTQSVGSVTISNICRGICARFSGGMGRPLTAGNYCPRGVAGSVECYVGNNYWTLGVYVYGSHRWQTASRKDFSKKADVRRFSFVLVIRFVVFIQIFFILRLLGCTWL